MVSTIASETEEQGPAGSSVVMVSVTEPPAISAGDGVYVAVAEDVLLKLPLPLVLQVKFEAPPPIDPERV
jgi:hypothetical protein